MNSKLAWQLKVVYAKHSVSSISLTSEYLSGYNSSLFRSCQLLHVSSVAAQESISISGFFYPTPCRPESRRGIWETLVGQRCQTPLPQGVSPNVRRALTISWSECVHGVMSVFKTQFCRVRGVYVLSMRDAEPRCEWCVNTCLSGLCNLHESR